MLLMVFKYFIKNYTLMHEILKKEKNYYRDMLARGYSDIGDFNKSVKYSR